MNERDVLVIAATIGGIAGVLANFVLSSIRRAFNDWRLRRARVCPGCRGLRVIHGGIEVEGVPIPVDMPCPVCNPKGKFARRDPAK